MSYFEKYTKYKLKYMKLKELLDQRQSGGGRKDITMIDALSDTPTNLELYGKDMDDFPNLKPFLNQLGGNDSDDEKTISTEESIEDLEKELNEIEKKKKPEDDEDDDSDENQDDDSDDDKDKDDDEISESDEEVSDILSSESQTGGFFGNLMDELSSSVKSMDLQGGGYYDDLSSLSSDERINIE